MLHFPNLICDTFLNEEVYWFFAPTKQFIEFIGSGGNLRFLHICYMKKTYVICCCQYISSTVFLYNCDDKKFSFLFNFTLDVALLSSWCDCMADIVYDFHLFSIKCFSLYVKQESSKVILMIITGFYFVPLTTGLTTL